MSDPRDLVPAWSDTFTTLLHAVANRAPAYGVEPRTTVEMVREAAELAELGQAVMRTRAWSGGEPRAWAEVITDAERREPK